MNFKKKIKRILALKTLLTQSGNTNPYWVYRLSINQVSLIFDASYRGCFGFLFRSLKFSRFVIEYNKLFNGNDGAKVLDSSILRLKLQNKAYNILPAMYYDLITVNSDLAKSMFIEYFGEEFTNTNQLERILKRISFLEEKLKSMEIPVQEQKAGLTFTETVNRIETSRAIPIDRNIKLYEFKTMYDNELEKWQN